MIIDYRDCVIIDGNLYFFREGSFVPMYMDLKSYEINFLPNVSDARLVESVADLVCSDGKNLYCLSSNGEYLIEYSLHNKEYKLMNINCSMEKDGNFSHMETIDNKIYVFTKCQRKFVVFDINKRNIENISYPCDCEKEYIASIRKDSTFILLPQNGNKILEYDIVNKSWNIYVLDNNIFNLVHAVCENEKVYMLDVAGNIYIWRIGESNVERICSIGTEKIIDGSIRKICLTEKSIIVLPDQANDIFIVNKADFKVQVYSQYPINFGYDCKRNLWTKYYGYTEDDNNYYWAVRTSGNLLVINKKTGDLNWVLSYVDDYKEFCARMENGIVYEEKGYLERLLLHVSEFN